MKKKVTLHYCFYLLFLFGANLLSCKEKHKSEEIVNSGEFAVQLRSWSFLGETDFQVIYNNLPNTLYERETLTIIKNYKDGEEPSDTLKVKINRKQEDSIYYYTYKYLTDFKINNSRDTNTTVREVHLDGLNFSLSLEGNEDKKLEATKYRTAGFKESSDEVSKLVAFINRMVPDNFRIY